MTASVKVATVNPLQRLISDRKEVLRLSYGDIARQGGLPKSTVHKLATTEQWTQAPHPETLDRLALGIRLPASTVRAAAAEAAGLTKVVLDHEDHGLRMLVGSLESLTPDELRQISALVDAMRANPQANRTHKEPTGE